MVGARLGVAEVWWQPGDPDVGDRFADVVGAVLAFTLRPGVRRAMIGQQCFAAKRAHGILREGLRRAV